MAKAQISDEDLRLRTKLKTAYTPPVARLGLL